MPTEPHLAALERRHADLEKQIADASARLGADNLEVTELKRRKLQLKDEIARLRTTLH